MRPLNVDHFFAAAPLLNAVAVIGYIAAVAVLVYAIGVHVRLDAQRTLQYSLPGGPAPAVNTGPCADATGIERGLCKADAKIDATKAKIRRHLEKRRVQESIVTTESLPARSYPGLMFVRDTLVWAAEQADRQPTRASNESGPQIVDGAAPRPGRSLQAITTAQPFGRR